MVNNRSRDGPAASQVLKVVWVSVSQSKGDQDEEKNRKSIKQ